ncbi:MAG: prepilin peptidase [Peptococcaceae bacterium]|nr:prepilin peptidase [Peptococcaceae bacterium]
MLWWALVFITGASVGSFLNVCIYRIPKDESIAFPPSHCPECMKRLGVIDLIPIFGYILLRGKCRYCLSRISWQYPAVELVTGLIYVFIVARLGLTIAALQTLVFLSLLVPVTIIDYKHSIIPDKINAVGVILGLPFLLQSREIAYSGIIGFFAGGGLLLIIAVISRGGMGGGDIKLASVMGLFLGWKYLFLALFIAFSAGAVVGGVLLMTGIKKRKDPIPFGPYLATGAIVSALFGQTLISRYLDFMHL